MVVIRMPIAHRVQPLEQSPAHASLVSSMVELELEQALNAWVSEEANLKVWTVLHESHILDPCAVNNGGCNANAACSSSGKDGAVTCTCKSGYLNNGTETGTGVYCISTWLI